MAEESCNQNNDILVRAEIRRSGEDRRAEEDCSPPGQNKLHWAQLSSPPPLSQSQIWKYQR